MKKLVLCLSILLLLTGCNSTKKEIKKEKSKGKCKITECIKLISINDNLEKVNEIVSKASLLNTDYEKELYVHDTLMRKIK